MSLPELDENDSRPFEESMRKGYLGLLQSQTDRAKRYLQCVRDLVEEARRRGAHPDDVPVGQNRHRSYFVPNISPWCYGRMGGPAVPGSGQTQSSSSVGVYKVSRCSGLQIPNPRLIIMLRVYVLTCTWKPIHNLI
eukprot:12406018-Karenia_brevis.AAC.1